MTFQAWLHISEIGTIRLKLPDDLLNHRSNIFGQFINNLSEIFEKSTDFYNSGLGPSIFNFFFQFSSARGPSLGCPPFAIPLKFQSSSH